MKHAIETRRAFCAELDRGASARGAARKIGVGRHIASVWASKYKRQKKVALVQAPETPRLPAHCSPGVLLHRTAAYVLHPSVQMEHFQAWLRFFVVEFGV